MNKEHILVVEDEEDITALKNRTLSAQAFVNLSDNDIKYSDQHSPIDVSAEIKESEIAIPFQDQGIGIPKEHQERIFERFCRIDKSRSRKLGGTGLGLAIVKQIVQAHNGHVSIDSTPGQGSTLSIHLPKNMAEK